MAGDRTAFWVDREVPGLSLLRADLTALEYAPHTHDALMVAVTERGGSGVRAGGADEEAHPGAVFVTNPVEPQASRMGRSRGWAYRSFYLEATALASVAADLGLPSVPAFDQHMYQSPALVGAFVRLHQALEGAVEPLLRRELWVSAFGALARLGGGRHRPEPARGDRQLLGRVLATMRERHAERLTLDELAGGVGLTPFQLIGMFRRGTGMTPHAQLTQLRLEEARRRLRAGDTIADAAQAAGFYDQSALTNRFRRCYGITPLQYVRAVRG